MGFGSCTISIFSCPAPAFGLGGPFFGQRVALTLTLVHRTRLFIHSLVLEDAGQI